MNDELKQQIKEYLTENLTVTGDVLSDPYGISDTIVVNLVLEGEVIGSVNLSS